MLFILWDTNVFSNGVLSNLTVYTHGKARQEISLSAQLITHYQNSSILSQSSKHEVIRCCWENDVCQCRTRYTSKHKNMFTCRQLRLDSASMLMICEGSMQICSSVCKYALGLGTGHLLTNFHLLLLLLEESIELEYFQQQQWQSWTFLIKLKSGPVKVCKWVGPKSVTFGNRNDQSLLKRIS